MLPKLLTLLISGFLFLTFAPPTFAVTVTINTYPSTISDQTFTINASVSGASAGTNYLRIDLYKDQTTNYFGETSNGTDYYGGSTYTQYLPITIQSGVTWTGDVQGRMGSPSSTQYEGVGTYKMRVRRYTSGGGTTASEANDSAVTVTISVPTPTPTQTPTPTTAPTNTNTPTPTKSPTSTPSPTSSAASPTPTKKPTTSPTPTKSKSESLNEEETPSPAIVLSATSPEEDLVQEPETSKKNLSLGKSFIAGGLALIGLTFLGMSGYSLFKGKGAKNNSDTMEAHDEDS